MLDVPIVWSLALRLPSLFTGTALHHAALHAARAGAAEVAEALYERAAAHYRLELEVEALARLRVHQLVTRARGARDVGREAELLLEAAQRLARIERIESFDPPFALVPAGTLFETGPQRAPARSAAAPAASGSGALRDAA